MVNNVTLICNNDEYCLVWVWTGMIAAVVSAYPFHALTVYTGDSCVHCTS